MVVMQFIIPLLCLQGVFAATIPTDQSNFTLPCDPNKGDGCSTVPTDCREVCGCDRTYIFDEGTGECILNMEYLKELTAAKNYVTADDSDMVSEDGIATKLRERVERVFKGIIASAIFFVVCASVCVLSVLIFCCHIRQSDRKLKNEVDALAKKLKIDINKKDTVPLMRKKPRDQIEESCNVVVQDANVMCV